MSLLRPAANQLIGKDDSIYALVVGIAKRAREIADELAENNQILEEKPVKTAINELAAGKYRIVDEPDLEEEEDKVDNSSIEDVA